MTVDSVLNVGLPTRRGLRSVDVQWVQVVLVVAVKW